ncbi:MAG: 30S ribosomal protein S17 [Candidatus Sungbacteria bacterium]|uniref:Small ribosomal subunit protein uS17 n=1 Tax=Candidatus Sungiibacteriota bacterium TaxID=2750080 RepID=A0A932YXI6_9BACT|nr:30S ribosomal protein S17 [Candidatus Sungbacteria bacterium]
MRTLQGTIVSNRMQKTVVVRVDRLQRHPKYRKYYRISRKFKAHVDPVQSGTAAHRIGDVVRITETRPLSKDKRWRVLDVIRRAPESPGAADNEEPNV